MTPWYAKLIAIGVAAGIITLASFLEHSVAQNALFALAGVVTGKEFFAKTGEGRKK